MKVGEREVIIIPGGKYKLNFMGKAMEILGIRGALGAPCIFVIWRVKERCFVVRMVGVHYGNGNGHLGWHRISTKHLRTVSDKRFQIWFWSAQRIFEPLERIIGRGREIWHLYDARHGYIYTCPEVGWSGWSAVRSAPMRAFVSLGEYGHILVQ